ncbi:hypothetical protein LTS18_003440 [Coniosporium uncinatum]|uniref:Uncharacterized protein n=1 Tax=Coniosporium uncinatum TaxID=93489 RepID=A0ACC3DTX3_9PEZI|nr:hypothetical protein LTS18_003440 [Coniosporium uncinatum]
MATLAHCAYCFEVLDASLNKRQPLSLCRVEELWELYNKDGEEEQVDGVEDEDSMDVDEDEDDETAPSSAAVPAATEPTKPPAISRLLQTPPTPSSSSPSANSSTPSLAASSATSASSKSSSRTSILSSLGRIVKKTKQTPSPSTSLSDEKESAPLFVTWNTISRNGHRSLRGCIGTFEAQELDEGLRSYALTSYVVPSPPPFPSLSPTILFPPLLSPFSSQPIRGLLTFSNPPILTASESSALEDTRFHPVSKTELQNLQVCVTLLHTFEPTPAADPMAWTIGIHGLRISFTYHGRRHSATYLPDVAREQGWTKEETIVSLMRKAGWSGRKEDWRRVGGMEVVRYRGEREELGWEVWRRWRGWVEETGRG